MSQINQQPVNQVNQQSSVTAALEAEEWFELLPIEKKLLAWTFGLGIVLLVVFILVFKVF